MQSPVLKLKGSVCTILLAAVVAAGGESPAAAAVPAKNPHYDIGASEYSDLAVKSLTHWTRLDFDAWGKTLSDDVEFYFPDGDAGTRTTLKGKAAVLNWWRNWKQTSGVHAMTYRDHVDIPVVAKETLPYSGLRGPMVISYFSNELDYSGRKVAIRMNVVLHFTSAKLVDRVYTYYDRTKIIEATGKNILAK